MSTSCNASESSMCTQVVVLPTRIELAVDLFHGTLDIHFQEKLQFSYYREIDNCRVLTAMAPADGRFHVYVLLEYGEPVDLDLQALDTWLEEQPPWEPHELSNPE